MSSINSCCLLKWNLSHVIRSQWFFYWMLSMMFLFSFMFFFSFRQGFFLSGNANVVLPKFWYILNLCSFTVSSFFCLTLHLCLPLHVCLVWESDGDWRQSYPIRITRALIRILLKHCSANLPSVRLGSTFITVPRWRTVVWNGWKKQTMA